MNSHEGHGSGHEQHSQKSQEYQGHNQHGNGNQGHGSHHAHMAADFKRRFWICLALTVPVLVLSPLIQDFFNVEETLDFSGDSYLLWVFSTAIFLYGGYPFIKGLYDELKSRQPGMMTLIGLAISVAYIYSSAVTFGLSGKVFYWELATLVDVMLLGHWLEMRSIMAASSALEELAKLMPSEAHKVDKNGQITDVRIEELVAGDQIIIKPGEKVPADGRVIEGESSVNEAMLTGESTPVPKSEGNDVIGGSINGEGSITVEVEKTGEESYLSQMTRLVQQAQESKSRSQNLADRAALWLTLIAITAGVLTIATWLTVFNEDFVFSLERMVTVMVITCPHALGLAIPLVVSVSTALAAKNALLIRDRNGFERARNIQAILFDKTGTLTKGEFGVTDVVVTDGTIDEKELLKMGAAVESRSEHPIAKGIVASAEDHYEIKDFQSIPGKGASGTVQNKKVAVVSPGYLKEKQLEGADADGRLREIETQGKTIVHVLIDDQPAGAIALADMVREESKEAITKLKSMGIQCMMITGDNEQVAKWVADEVGLDEYFAGVSPDEKADKVKQVQARGLVVAMTGDGVNDAPALAQADVGIAIGTGTDVAAASADIILVRSNPMDAVSIVELSRATYRKMLQNLGWATGYNAFAIPLAAGAAYNAGILLSPAVGAALMSLSTVIVAINARFLKLKTE